MPRAVAARATRRCGSRGSRSTCSRASGRSRSSGSVSRSARSARCWRSRLARTESSTGWTDRTSRGRCLAASLSCSCSESRGSSSRSSGSTSGGSSATSRGARCTPSTGKSSAASLMAKRVLVTGGAGFISSNFIRHLLAKTPHEVVSLDALTYAGNLENLGDVMSHERLSFVHGDVRDAELVRDVVAEVDVIVNAAAESHVEKSIADGASEFVTTNVEGTQILLDAVRETPVERFILISSSEVYGTAERAPFDEEHPLNPRSPYAATKAGADRLAYSYFVTYGLPIVIVRPFNNYGPRQHPEKAIPKFVTSALSDEPLTIHGDGHASRDWLYVDDDAEAIEAVIEADLGAVAGEVVNVATGIDISIDEVADLVLELVGRPESLKAFVTERPGQVDRHIGSTDKLERLTGWRARTSFEDGRAPPVSGYRD